MSQGELSRTKPAGSASVSCRDASQNDKLVTIWPLRYGLPILDLDESRQLTPAGYPKIAGDYSRQPLRQGWLYVRDIDQNIWYEYQIDDGDTLIKCDWQASDIGQDQRRANGERVNFLTFKVGVQLELCYSPQQWTWKTYTALYNDSARRGQRMQRIDTGSWCSLGEESDCLSVEQLDKLIDGSFSDGIAVRQKEAMLDVTLNALAICLHDPLHIARQLNEQYTTQLEGRLQHREDEKTKVEVAEMASTVIKQQPSYAGQLRQSDMEIFLRNYTAEQQRRSTEVDTAINELLEWLNLDGPHSPATVLRDFDLDNDQQHFNAEHVWALLLQHTEQHPQGVKFLSDQFEKSVSILNILLNVTKLVTTATDAIVEKMVVANVTPQRFKLLLQVIERRYRIQITQISVAAEDYLGNLHGVVNGKNVPVGQQVLQRLQARHSSGFYQLQTRQTLVSTQRLPAVTSYRVSVAGKHYDVSHWGEWAKDTGLKGTGSVLFMLNAYSLIDACNKYDFTVLELTNVGSNLIGAGLAFQVIVSRGGSGLTAAVRTYSSKAATLTGVVRGISTKTLNTLGIIPAALDTLYNGTKLWQEVQSHDYDAAVSYGASAAGALMGVAAGMIALGGGTTLTVAGAPAGVVLVVGGVVVGVAGAISLMWTDNSAVEDWLTYCLWGKEPYTGSYKQGRNTFDSSEWKSEPAKQIEAFFRAIYTYSIEADWDIGQFGEDSFTIDVETPHYVVGQSQYSLSITFEQANKTIYVDDYRGFPNSLNEDGGEHGKPFVITWKLSGNQIPSGCKEAIINFSYQPNKNDPLIIPNQQGESVDVERSW